MNKNKESGSTDECNQKKKKWLENTASLAQSVERKALNLVVAGSSPAGGAFFFFFFPCLPFRGAGSLDAQRKGGRGYRRLVRRRRRQEGPTACHKEKETSCLQNEMTNEMANNSNPMFNYRSNHVQPPIAANLSTTTNSISDSAVTSITTTVTTTTTSTEITRLGTDSEVVPGGSWTTLQSQHARGLLRKRCY